MGFRDPIVAGTKLIRTAVESVDYVPGVSGWSIQRNGDAEFNDAVFRGTIESSVLISDDPIDDERVRIGDGEISLRRKSDNIPIGSLYLSESGLYVLLESNAAQIRLPILGSSGDLLISNSNTHVDSGLTLTAPKGIDLLADSDIDIVTQSAGGLIDLRANGVGSRVKAEKITFSRARYFRSAAQTIITSTPTIWDIDSVHGTDNVSSSISATGVITIAEEGLYLITANALFAANATGRREMQVLHNGSQIIRADDTPVVSVTRGLNGSVCTLVNAGDTISMEVTQTSGGNLNLNGGAFVGGNTRMTIVRLGTQTVA